MPFNPSKLEKGTLTLTQSRRVIKFMFNPTTVRRQHGWNYNQTPVGGRSHPFRAGGSGQNESLNLTLYLDGDMGRVNQRPRPFSDLKTIFATPPLSIEPELNDLRALTLPYDPDFGEAYGMPETVLFNLGNSYRSLECQVDSSAEEIHFFTPKLEPVKATVDLVLSVMEEFNRTSWVFLAENPSATLDDNTALVEFGDRRKIPIISRDPVPGGLGGLKDPFSR